MMDPCKRSACLEVPAIRSLPHHHPDQDEGVSGVQCLTPYGLICKWCSRGLSIVVHCPCPDDQWQPDCLAGAHGIGNAWLESEQGYRR